MYKESKKLSQFLDDLKKMKKELKPKGEEDAKQEQDMKNMDKFGKKKHELNTLLKQIREDANKLTDLRRRNGDKRDAETMRLINDNTKALGEAKTGWQQLKALLQEDVQKRAGKLGEKELTDRQKHLQLFGEEIQKLSGVFVRVKGAGPTSIDEIPGARTTDKTQKRREEKQARKDKAQAKREGRNGGGFVELDEHAFEQNLSPISAQEQKFMDQVDANKANQDNMLDEISKGLDELKQMGLDINKQLKVQAAIIDEVEQEMDQTIVALKSANSKMKDMLETSGGMSRWCPIMCCFMLLLAILGYIFSAIPT